MARNSQKYCCKPQPMPHGFESIVFLEKDDLAYVGKRNLLAIREAWLDEIACFEPCIRAYSHMRKAYGAETQPPTYAYSRHRCRRANASIRLIDGMLMSADDKPLFCSARKIGYFNTGDKVYVWIDPRANRKKAFRSIESAGYYVGEFLGHVVENTDYVCVSLPVLDGDCKNYCLPFRNAYILSEADMHYLSYDPEYCEYFISLCGFDYLEDEAMLYEISQKREEFVDPPEGLDIENLPVRPLTLIC